MVPHQLQLLGRRCGSWLIAKGDLTFRKKASVKAK
jgi:hypothetical protein